MHPPSHLQHRLFCLVSAIQSISSIVTDECIITRSHLPSSVPLFLDCLWNAWHLLPLHPFWHSFFFFILMVLNFSICFFLNLSFDTFFHSMCFQYFNYSNFPIFCLWFSFPSHSHDFRYAWRIPSILTLPFAPISISIFNPLFNSVISASLQFLICLLLYPLTVTSSGLNLPMFLLPNCSSKQRMLQNAASIICLKSIIKFFCSKNLLCDPCHLIKIDFHSIFYIFYLDLHNSFPSSLILPSYCFTHTTLLSVSDFCSYCSFKLGMSLHSSHLYPTPSSIDILYTFKGQHLLL